MLYVDYTGCLTEGSSLYTGGKNYTLHIIELLINNGENIGVIVTKDYSLLQEEKKIFNSRFVTIVRVDKLKDIIFVEQATLFIPLLPVRKLRIVCNIKKNNPSVKVYITIHGVRVLDLKYDFLDKYYYDGINYLLYPIIGRGKQIIAKILYKKQIRKYICKYDKVFTVSNDSLQKIVSISTHKNIKWFYQGNNYEKNSANSHSSRYILFVSGNRKEKNLLRCMIAFSRYKCKYKVDDLKMVITGIDQHIAKLFLRCKYLDLSSIQDNFKFVGYVSNKELEKLYSDALYIVYPSKSEGFGLPVQEAFAYKKPVLASFVCGIPEVTGATISYINPYSIESMMDGFASMNDQELQRQIKSMDEQNEIILKRARVSEKQLLYELLN